MRRPSQPYQSAPTVTAPVAPSTLESMEARVMMSTVTTPSPIDFTQAIISSYGVRQDALNQADVSVEDGGATLHIAGNGWKKIALSYTITPTTVLEFDF
jgi:hypothetical protein